MSRLFVYTKDVEILTGRGRKVATRLLAEVRKKYDKARYDLVTVIEFCDYTGLDLKMVVERLK
ncbi:hypothetical protein D3C87_1649530 [compost metagenome]